MSTKEKVKVKLQKKDRTLSRIPSNDAVSRAVVLYDFESKSEAEEEISLCEGEEVEILRKYDDGWCWIRCERISGWFPLNYLEEKTENVYQTATSLDDDYDISNKIDEVVIAVMTAKYPFKAHDDTELTVTRGETLNVLDMSDKNWYQVKNRNGQIGMVPAAYLSQASCVDEEEEEDENIEDKPWYFGNITSRNQSDQILDKFGRPGDFLIRRAETQYGNFTVSLKTSGRNKNFQVSLQQDGAYCIGKKKFLTLQKLVDHYQTKPIFTEKNGSKYFLRTSPRK